MKIILPNDVEIIINQLHNNGYEAFAVGGCVRDSLLNILPNDWDVCTDAYPDQIIHCFDNYTIINTGIKHGTVTIVISNKNYEITTYRSDGKYSDGRHPDTVKFIKSLKEDLRRRDFTINAMAYNYESELIDYFGGENDLNNKIIKCVGNCAQRLSEDALRILRALRFAAKYCFEIEHDTSKAIFELKELLLSLSAERIKDEFNKLLLCSGIEEILLKYFSVLSVIIPEITPAMGYDQNNPYHIYDVWRHTVKSIVYANDDIIIRLTMFFHDLSKSMCYSNNNLSPGYFLNHAEKSAEIAKNILVRLKYDNETINRVYQLIFFHDTKISADRIQIKRWLNKIGKQCFCQLLEVKKADAKAQNPLYLTERLKTCDEIYRIANEIIEKNLCYDLNNLDINGKDIIAMGYDQGIQIGNILEYLLNLVIDEKIENNKEILKKEINNFLKQK